MNHDGVTLVLERHRDSIDDCLDSFDFERVHDTMKALGWKWYNTPDGFSVPSLYDIKRKARRLTLEACRYVIENGGEYWMKSGGFCVITQYDKDTDKLKYELQFIVAEIDNHLED